MTSAISYSDINAEYPIPGKDNDSQGFRTNFSLIKTGLEVAASEISLMQAGKADLTTANLFANTTPSYSTSTGAVIVQGGVGIGGDLNVGGNVSFAGGAVAISTASMAPMTMNGDVTFSGTYGEPTYSTNGTLLGDKFFPSSVAVGGANPLIGVNLIYAETTQTSQIAVNSAVKFPSGTALQLSSWQSATFLRFINTPPGIDPSELSKITTDGTNLLMSGAVKFTGTLTTTSLVIPTATPTRTSPGVAGQMAQGGGFLYVCTGTNAWSRVQLTAVY